MCASHPPSSDTLTFPAYLHAETIHIVGDFNGWNQWSHALQRTARGQWTIGWPHRTRCRRFYLLLDRTRWLTVDSIDFLLLERWHALPPSALFTWAGQSMAMGQFLAWIDRWCDTLAYVGVAKGAVVALPLADSLTTLALLLALFRRQSIVVPLAQLTPRPTTQTLAPNDLPRQAEWVISWQVDGAAHYVRCNNTAPHRTIHHLRSLGHPGLLYPMAQDQRQIQVIDIIDDWMPSEFHRLLQTMQGGFSIDMSIGGAPNAITGMDRSPIVAPFTVDRISKLDNGQHNKSTFHNTSPSLQ